MTAYPQVSVVMSVYNGATQIRDTLLSVLSQTGVDFEVIVINDGSRDETASILKSMAATDSRLRVVNQENTGLTRALIRGCDLARGEYIARQDVGDNSLARRLEIQKQALDADSELSFVCCWTEVCGPGKEYLSLSKGAGPGCASVPTYIISESSRHGVIDGPSHHGAVMFRRDHYLKVGGYRREFYFGQDWDLWYRLGEIGKFQMAQEVLYQARVMPSSISGQYRNEQRRIADLYYEMLLRRRKGLGEEDLLKIVESIRPLRNTPISRSLRANGVYFIGEQLRRNGHEQAEAYLLEAVRICPTMLKTWIRLGQLWLAPKGRAGPRH